MLFTWYLIFSVWKGKGDLQICLGQNSKTGGPKSLQELYHLWEEVWRQEGNWRHHCQQEEIPVWRGSEGMYYKYSLGSPYIQLLLKLHECLLIWRLMSFMLPLILSPRKYQENTVLFGGRIPSMGEKMILAFTAFFVSAFSCRLWSPSFLLHSELCTLHSHLRGWCSSACNLLLHFCYAVTITGHLTCINTFFVRKQVYYTFLLFTEYCIFHHFFFPLSQFGLFAFT